MTFQHLIKANQTYFEHFQDSLFYFRKSLKATFYFFVHALYPDLFEFSGSKEIFELHEAIVNKYKKEE
jgi:hypothetical protein